jgi:hypothetical protein
MYVRVREDLKAATGNRRYQPGVLIGLRTYTPADGPIELDDKLAARLIKEGTVEAVAMIPGEPMQRATKPKLQASRR